MDTWIEIFKKEYLRDFIKNGGSSVKFIITEDESESEVLRKKLINLSNKENYCFISLDSASTKLHEIQSLFNEIAKQIEWENYVYVFLKKLFAKNKYKFPSNKEQFTLSMIAELNGHDSSQLLNDIKGLLTKELFKDFKMSQEFRIAMMKLCINQLYHDESESSTNYILQWLKGELKLITTLKGAMIFQKINRFNARHMFLSLSHWLKSNDKNGIVMVLDISRYFVSSKFKNQNDGLYYTPNNIIDLYELLRQFIDDTDELENCMIIVISSNKDFEHDEKRGLTKYDALRMRIINDVKDEKYSNPLASLIRISDFNKSEVTNE